MSMFSVGWSAGASVGSVLSPPRAPVGASYLEPISGHVRTRRRARTVEATHEERGDGGEPEPPGQRGVVEREPGPATNLLDEVVGQG